MKIRFAQNINRMQNKWERILCLPQWQSFVELLAISPNRPILKYQHRFVPWLWCNWFNEPEKLDVHNLKKINSLIHWLVNHSQLNIVVMSFGFHGKIRSIESFCYLQQQQQLQTQQQNEAKYQN